jgi:hypothetical protein
MQCHLTDKSKPLDILETGISLSKTCQVYSMEISRTDFFNDRTRLELQSTTADRMPIYRTRKQSTDLLIIRLIYKSSRRAKFLNPVVTKS